MKKIFTIPNIISFFRLLLIPLFVVVYLNEAGKDEFFWSVIILLVSGASDVVDGFIARRFKMTSDLGKVLDPIADKLTQVVVVLCIAIKHPEIIPMFAVLFIKELMTLLAAVSVLSRGNKPISSKWFGKLSTVMIFLTMFYAIIVDIWPVLPQSPLYILTALSIVGMLISIAGYFKIFNSFIKVKGADSDNEIMR